MDMNMSSKIKEVSILKDSINSLKDYFSVLLKEIHSETNNLRNLESSMNQSAQNLSDIVTEQQQSTKNTAIQMEQLKSSFMQVAAHASQTNEFTIRASNLTCKGTELMKATSRDIKALADEVNETNLTLNSLKKDTESIDNALEVIEEFSEKTNLLALNASIEAARAGDMGRGFAVVADEVRNLAASTADAANDIKKLTCQLHHTTRQVVERTQAYMDKTNDTVETAKEAQRSIEHIEKAITSVSEMSAQIASATEEQSVLTTEIVSVMVKNTDLANHSLKEAENNKSYANNLVSISGNLNQMIVQFE